MRDLRLPRQATKSSHKIRAKGCLVSGCRDRETSADACPSGDASEAFGALTNAITTVILQNETGYLLTNSEVVTAVRAILNLSP